ncbi:MAG: S46 family peptidase [Bacteroidetes bacterium]|nr:S46 family peptidase [Bacteroidota bacterium]
MKRLLSLLAFLPLLAFSKEGMWLPHLLEQINQSDMQQLGLQIPVQEIYSINQSSLKDAVVQFGAGCTGELISPQGLLVTNHHCGFSQIQSLSTIEKNYLEDGFWAKSFSEEMPCPGLSVTFIREIRDVSSIVLKDISNDTPEDIRAKQIKSRSDSLEKSLTVKSVKGLVRSFNSGNEYYLFITEVFKDIRFVGAPPSQLGKYGGETDNWVWPRHTCDFSLFRIYVDSANHAADYSPKNVPFKASRFLTINIGEKKEGDYVMVYGFPGRTSEYLSSSSLDIIYSCNTLLNSEHSRIIIRNGRARSLA